MGVKLLFDPFGLVLEVFNELYPQHECEVIFGSRMPEATFGYTDFAQSPPWIIVGFDIPMAGVVEVLAHELAHVVAGLEADHGPEWEAAFNAIHNRYTELFSERLAPIDGCTVIEGSG